MVIFIKKKKQKQMKAMFILLAEQKDFIGIQIAQELKSQQNKPESIMIKLVTIVEDKIKEYHLYLDSITFFNRMKINKSIQKR